MGVVDVGQRSAVGSGTASTTAGQRVVPVTPSMRDHAGHDRLTALAAAIAAQRAQIGQNGNCSRTARLVAGGVPKMAKKMIEEATEIAIDAVRGNRGAVISETADLFYNLTVLLSEMGIAPAEVWREMDRREALLGIAEKLPKAISAATKT